MGTKHYIAMAGMRGYLPNSCEVYWDLGDASEDLANMHDLTDEQKAKLEEDLFLTLPEDAGNEYASIEVCDCDEPMIHSDSGELEPPPDPDGYNDSRAAAAQVALDAYAIEIGDEGNAQLYDLLVNLMHWADRNNESFNDALERAREMYIAETTPEESAQDE